MEVKFYASSNTSHYGISQTLTLEQLEYNGKTYKFECVWQGEIKTNFASGRKQATHNAVEKLFKVVECE